MTFSCFFQEFKFFRKVVIAIFCLLAIAFGAHGTLIQLGLPYIYKYGPSCGIPLYANWARRYWQIDTDDEDEKLLDCERNTTCQCAVSIGDLEFYGLQFFLSMSYNLTQAFATTLIVIGALTLIDATYEFTSKLRKLLAQEFYNVFQGNEVINNVISPLVFFFWILSMSSPGSLVVEARKDGTKKLATATRS